MGLEMGEKINLRELPIGPVFLIRTDFNTLFAATKNRFGQIMFCMETSPHCWQRFDECTDGNHFTIIRKIADSMGVDFSRARAELDGKPLPEVEQPVEEVVDQNLRMLADQTEVIRETLESTIADCRSLVEFIKVLTGRVNEIEKRLDGPDAEPIFAPNNNPQSPLINRLKLYQPN